MGGSYLLHQSCLDGFNRNPQALNGAVWQLHANALQVRAELALCDFRHMRSNAAAFFGDTFAVNNAARDGALSSDGTDTGHGFRSVKRGRS